MIKRRGFIFSQRDKKTQSRMKMQIQHGFGRTQREEKMHELHTKTQIYF